MEEKELLKNLETSRMLEEHAKADADIASVYLARRRAQTQRLQKLYEESFPVGNENKDNLSGK